MALLTKQDVPIMLLNENNGVVQVLIVNFQNVDNEVLMELVIEPLVPQSEIIPEDSILSNQIYPQLESNKFFF